MITVFEISDHNNIILLVKTETLLNVVKKRILIIGGAEPDVVYISWNLDESMLLVWREISFDAKMIPVHF